MCIVLAFMSQAVYNIFYLILTDYPESFTAELVHFISLMSVLCAVISLLMLPPGE